jgi:hypothetical protein
MNKQKLGLLARGLLLMSLLVVCAEAHSQQSRKEIYELQGKDDVCSQAGIYKVADQLKQLGFVGYWHLADIPTAPAFVRYWTNNGQRSARSWEMSAAIDPLRSCTAQNFRSAN